MTSDRSNGAAAVAFHVYTYEGFALHLVAGRLRELLPLPVAERWGPVRGNYYRWSGDDGADLLLQTNVVDEAGVPAEPGVVAGVPVLYATGLAAPVLAALAALDGGVLVSADVVEVPDALARSAVVVPV